MSFLAVLETDGRTWSAYVPDLPGCIAATTTEEEVVKLIEEAVVFHIEGLREMGLPVPQPTNKPHTISKSA